MIYYRIAIQTNQMPSWQWKSGILNSLHTVLGLLRMYRCTSQEHIRVFLSCSPEALEEMLAYENQGLLSTAITVNQLWDRQRTNWLEIKRLEIELGPAGDHDCPYTFSMPTNVRQVMAWSTLLAGVEHGELEPYG